MPLRRLSRIRILLANALCAVCDAGVGAFIALSVTLYLQIPLTPELLLVGILAALLPDMDIVPHIILGERIRFSHHQTWWHRPLLLLPMVTSAALWFLGTTAAIITLLGLLYHYLHDTEWRRPPKDGIAWLWPFSQQYLSWFGLYPPPPTTNHRKMLKQYWLQPSGRSEREISIGLGLYSAVILVSPLLSPLYLLPSLFVIGSAVFVWSGNQTVDNS